MLTLPEDRHGQITFITNSRHYLLQEYACINCKYFVRRGINTQAEAATVQNN